jgi:hypothetical protein
MRLELSLASLLSQATALVESGEALLSPLSPDFSGENDQSEADSLPLKQSSSMIKLNGNVIQVVETQISCKLGDAPINAAIIKMEAL